MSWDEDDEGDDNFFFGNGQNEKERDGIKNMHDIDDFKYDGFNKINYLENMEKSLKNSPILEEEEEEGEEIIKDPKAVVSNFRDPPPPPPIHRHHHPSLPPFLPINSVGDPKLFQNAFPPPQPPPPPFRIDPPSQPNGVYKMIPPPPKEPSGIIFPIQPNTDGIGTPDPNFIFNPQPPSEELGKKSTGFEEYEEYDDITFDPDLLQHSNPPPNHSITNFQTNFLDGQSAEQPLSTESFLEEYVDNGVTVKDLIKKIEENTKEWNIGSFHLQIIFGVCFGREPNTKEKDENCSDFASYFRFLFSCINNLLSAPQDPNRPAATISILQRIRERPGGRGKKRGVVKTVIKNDKKRYVKTLLVRKIRFPDFFFQKIVYAIIEKNGYGKKRTGPLSPMGIIRNFLRICKLFETFLEYIPDAIDPETSYYHLVENIEKDLIFSLNQMKFKPSKRKKKEPQEEEEPPKPKKKKKKSSSASYVASIKKTHLTATLCDYCISNNIESSSEIFEHFKRFKISTEVNDNNEIDLEKYESFLNTTMFSEEEKEKLNLIIDKVANGRNIRFILIVACVFKVYEKDYDVFENKILELMKLKFQTNEKSKKRKRNNNEEEEDNNNNNNDLFGDKDENIPKKKKRRLI